MTEALAHARGEETGAVETVVAVEEGFGEPILDIRGDPHPNYNVRKVGEVPLDEHIASEAVNKRTERELTADIDAALAQLRALVRKASAGRVPDPSTVEVWLWSDGTMALYHWHKVDRDTKIMWGTEGATVAEALSQGEMYQSASWNRDMAKDDDAAD